VEAFGFREDLGAYNAPNTPRSPFLPRSFAVGLTEHGAHVSVLVPWGGAVVA
jgi:hypothetical protein